VTTVYRKSTKGLHEIEIRANRLGPRLRTALILVDGRRSDADLRMLIQLEPDATLLALIDTGYIEVVTTRPAAAQSAPASSPSEAAPAPASAGGLAERRRLAVRRLTDKLGPLADTVALRIEKTRGWDVLCPALEAGMRLLQTVRGKAAAT